MASGNKKKRHNQQKKNKDWLKPKPYPHFSPKIGFQQGNREKRQKAKEEFKAKIAHLFKSGKHNFYPLLKYTKYDKQYKKWQDDEGYYYLNAQGKYIRKAKAKKRPIEFATHIDAQLYAYFAQKVFCPQYERKLKQHPLMNKGVIGYRTIPVKLKEATEEAKETGVNTKEKDKKPPNQSNIEMAADFFDEVLALAQTEDCVVLTFDISDFFPSIDHQLLFAAWARLFDADKLDKCHYRIYRAVTQYSYIYRNDLQRHLHGNQRAMDKQMRHNIEQGVEAYFESPRHMRAAIRQGQIHIYKNKKKGIPHGLAISSHLANAYMWNFDQTMCTAVARAGGHYRRYSDDIIMVLPISTKEETVLIEEWDTLAKAEIEKLKLKLSSRKSEIYKVAKADAQGNIKIEAKVKVVRNGEAQTEWRQQGITYLGLELFGQKAGQKQIYLRPASIARFQNKMRRAVHRAVRRAYARQTKECLPEPVIFYNGLKKRFTLEGIKKGPRQRSIKKLKYDQLRGVYDYEVSKKTMPAQQGSALSYARKMDKYVYDPPPGETGKAVRQFRNAKKLLFREIEKAKKKYGGN